LLIAPSPSNQKPDRSSSDPLGYYADGAYTAAPKLSNGSATGPRVDEETDPQETYYASLLARFADLSTALQNPPPTESIPSSVAGTAQGLNTGYKSRWRSTLNTQPSTVLISLLSQETVLQGLRMLETRLTTEQLSKRQSLGLWVWGLLGRCRDVGQMGSEEIGILRDLGKKAIWLLRVMRAGSQRVEDDEENYTESGSEFDGKDNDHEAIQSSNRGTDILGVKPQSAPAMNDSQNEIAETSADSCSDLQTADGLEAARASLLASLPSGTALPTIRTPERASPSARPSSAPSNSSVPSSSKAPVSQQAIDQIQKPQAVLDMIITIVGEFYGQKDLLDGRVVWGELEYG